MFDGNPSSHQEWRKRISIYHLKMKLQKRSVEAVLNLTGSLQGTAWKLVESYNVTAILDAAFKYDARVCMPQDFGPYFNLSRRPGTTLLNFVTEHDEKLRKLAEHGVKLPDHMHGRLASFAACQLDKGTVLACALPGSKARET